MHRIASGRVPGGGFFIACGRKPARKRCATCAVLGAELECDGCDKPLCTACAVSPRHHIDFCPRCFIPAWKHWLQLQPRSIGSMPQQQRRTAFRCWARSAVDVFLKLVPLGKVATAAKPQPTARELWEQAGGHVEDDGTCIEADPEKYRALLVEHGLVVKGAVDSEDE